MSNESVLFSVKNGVATIKLNEPKSLNALSKNIVEGLIDSLKNIKEDNSIRAVILTGSGRGFCAGGDITSFPKGNSAALGRTYMQKMQTFIKEWSELEKPIIAVVNGYAVGAGFSLALACDFVIAAENSKFAMAFNKMGVVPDLGGLYHLPRVVGMARAKELAYSDRTLSAQEAKEYGICLEVVPDSEVLHKSQEIAEIFAKGPGYSIGMTKAILSHSLESSLEQILREEAMAQGISFTTNDHRAGVEAFFEKKAPIFSGN